MTCPVCGSVHDNERLGISKEVSGLNGDMQVEGSFCPALELWIVKSSLLYRETAGIVTFPNTDVSLLES